MSPQEKLARISLSYLLPNQKALAALTHFGSALTALQEVDCLNPSNALPTTISEVEREGLLNRALVYGEVGYPDLLNDIPDPPLVLFYRGNKKALAAKVPKIALVGTRKASGYGLSVANLLAEECVLNGFLTISGMAFGIDTAVHSATLDKGGVTVAVLGTGIEQPYPATNRWVYDRIISEGGAVVSEIYKSEKYTKWVFPKRNRIIAGMADYTVIVEAAAKSGALITGRLAFSYNRRVFAVPGSIFSETFKGNLNMLFSQKAELIRRIEDIGIQSLVSRPSGLEPISKEQELLLENVGGEIGLIELQKRLGWEDAIFFQHLGALEINGNIEVVQGSVRSLSCPLANS